MITSYLTVQDLIDPPHYLFESGENTSFKYRTCDITGPKPTFYFRLKGQFPRKFKVCQESFFIFQAELVFTEDKII